MNPLILIPVLASLISNISKSQKAEGYKKDVEGYNKKQIADADKEKRKAAILRALGGNAFEAMPKPTELPPEAPSTQWEDVLGGIAEAGNMYLGMSQYGPYGSKLGKLGRQGVMKGVGKNYMGQDFIGA